MQSVQLIVTGSMERIALHKSLNNVFKDLEFWEPIFSECFTSNPITSSAPPPQEDLLRTVDKLVNALFANIETGRHRDIPDMVILLDDLELANLNQPQVVIEYFLQAVRFKLRQIEQNSNRRTYEQFEKRLQENCSFHLFVPMTEAYFFGEGQTALDRAGARINSTVSGQDIDVEDFLVTEHIHNGVDYLNASKGSAFWAKNETDRAQHPKRYLDFLCSLETELNEFRYKETAGGVEALNDLSWLIVLSESDRVKYLRSLFEDIADRFALPEPFPGDHAPLTRCTNRRILRNM